MFVPTHFNRPTSDAIICAFIIPQNQQNDHIIEITHYL
nr:MAG TPA: hypothetical protein [Caudoviricetes sp.]